MKHQLLFTLSVLAASGSVAFAQDGSIAPETLTVEPRISEGQHVYVLDFGMNGSSPIYVFNVEDLSLDGNIGTGTFGQMTMTPDKSSLYSASGYLRRYTYGDVEAVIHEWDPVTLKAKREFMISNKMAQAISQAGVFNLTADGAYMLVQNATPATSVNVVDLAAGQDLVEIPTPGCWAAYPLLQGNAFTSLCGDGTITRFGFAADGTMDEPAKSEKIFDPDADPLFAHGVRVGDKMVFPSFSGSMFVVDDSGDVPVLTDSFRFAEDGWAPSGNELMAYHAPSNTMFVQMHSGPNDGSHKYPAEEIWAVDMDSHAVIGRSEAHGETGIFITQGETPMMFGIDHMGGLHKYEVSLGDTASVTQTGERPGVAIFPTMVATDF